MLFQNTIRCHAATKSYYAIEFEDKTTGIILHQDKNFMLDELLVWPVYVAVGFIMGVTGVFMCIESCRTVFCKHSINNV